VLQLEITMAFPHYFLKVSFLLFPLHTESSKEGEKKYWEPPGRGRQVRRVPATCSSPSSPLLENRVSAGLGGGVGTPVR